MLCLTDVIRKLEEMLKIDGKYLYRQAKIKQGTYSTWKTGRIKRISTKKLRQFADGTGIDLQQSMERGEIVVVNAAKLSEAHFRTLVTDGPVKI